MASSSRHATALAVLLLALAGCGSASRVTTAAHSTAPTSRPPQTPSRPAPSSQPRPTKAQRTRSIAHDPHAYLEDLVVTRHGRTIAVQSEWEDRRGYALTTSSDGFRHTRYAGPGEGAVDRVLDRGAVHHGAGKLPTCADNVDGTILCSTPHGLQWSHDGGHTWQHQRLALTVEQTALMESLRPGTLVAIGGTGDDGTPMRTIERSDDDGATWKVFPAQRFDGAPAVPSGALVLPDGRILAQLSDFDALHPRTFHVRRGLWVQASIDSGHFVPWHATFSPPLPRSRPRDYRGIFFFGDGLRPDPVIFAGTLFGRVYVSTDDARTFHEIPSR